MKEVMNILLTEIFIINPFKLIINIKFYQQWSYQLLYKCSEKLNTSNKESAVPNEV